MFMWPYPFTLQIFMSARFLADDSDFISVVKALGAQPRRHPRHLRLLLALLIGHEMVLLMMLFVTGSWVWPSCSGCIVAWIFEI